MNGQHTKRQTRLLFALYIALLLIAAVAVWKAVDYRFKNHDLHESLLEAGRAGQIEPVSHLAEQPHFVFESLQVSWDQLAPRLAEIYGSRVEKKVVGTFPVPHDFAGTDVSAISFDQQTIRFPQYGPFYLHTTIGFFKILLLDPASSMDDKIIAISRFVSGNTVHSMADERRICPVFLGRIFTPENLSIPFFASDQPLKLHCNSASRFLAWLLQQRGYDVRLVGLQTADPVRGHFVIDVLLPTQNKFAMIDTDYGALMRAADGTPLSVREIAEYAARNRIGELQVDDLADKHALKSIYNNAEPMPGFTWTPDKSNSANRFVEPEQYRQVWRDYSAHVTYYRMRAGTWQESDKFSR